MDANSPHSWTALRAGLGRAAHCLWDEAPHVFHDLYGYVVMGAEAERALIKLRRVVGEENYRLMRASVAWRSRVAEEVLDRALAGGTRQYALMGAGMDSFALRRGHLLPDLQVYEVDHLATQAWKRERLAALGIAAPAGLNYVPADLGRESGAAALRRAGWDGARPGVVNWIAVAMYLAEASILATLRDLATLGRGTQVVMTYLLPEESLSGRELEIMRNMRTGTAHYGEPFLSFHTPDGIEALLRSAGFGAVDHHPPEDSECFRGRRDGLKPYGIERLVVGIVR
ncbi:MAG: class I SAM-dependent methyltransferase [Gammaproteobacteria bacterium]